MSIFSEFCEFYKVAGLFLYFKKDSWVFFPPAPMRGTFLAFFFYIVSKNLLSAPTLPGLRVQHEIWFVQVELVAVYFLKLGRVVSNGSNHILHVPLLTPHLRRLALSLDLV